MGMAQISGKHRYPLFDINAGLVPVDERAHRKSVAKVMDPRPEAISSLSQTDLATKSDESPTDHAVGERRALIG